jgi:hypothetical protein
MEYYKEYVRNDAGIMIVKCCASCKHHLSDPVREHICQCTLHHIRRRLDDACSDHYLNDHVNMFSEVSMRTLRAKSTGRIKKPEYVRYIQEKIANIKGDSMSQTEFANMMADLRETWERDHGSRYIENF